MRRRDSHPPCRDTRRPPLHPCPCVAVPSTDLGVKAADDAQEASWFDVGELPHLAFDHKLVVRTAFEVLAKRPEAAGSEPLQQELHAAVAKLQGPWK